MYNEKLIGEKFIKLRQEKNITRNEFADIMSVTVQAVGKWERGESLPDILTMKRAADFFGVGIDYFFNTEENNANETKKHSEAHERNCDNGKEESFEKPSWDMSASVWKNVDFSELRNIASKFKNSSIFNCEFRNSGLDGVTLKGNSMKDCDFTGASMSNGTLIMCSLNNNNFNESNLKNSNIKISNINCCNLSSANLSGVEINASLIKKCNFNDAKLNKTVFKNSNLERTVITGNIVDCSFINTAIRNVEFFNVTFKNTFLKNTSFKQSTFINCKADKISYCFLKNCKINMNEIDLLEE